MDQNPLPRGSFQVRDRTGEEFRVVPELPEAAVAVEAQYPAHPAGAMIVIYVLRVARATDDADAPLRFPAIISATTPTTITIR